MGLYEQIYKPADKEILTLQIKKEAAFDKIMVSVFAFKIDMESLSSKAKKSFVECA